MKLIQPHMVIDYTVLMPEPIIPIKIEIAVDVLIMRPVAAMLSLHHYIRLNLKHETYTTSYIS